MALDKTTGTNYSYVPPKPPKPVVNYGAPSGPYASPASVQQARLQQTIQQPMQGPWRGMGQTELARLGDPFAFDYSSRSYKRELTDIPHVENPMLSKFLGGFWGTFDPRNIPKIPAGVKYAVENPGDALRQTFTTPEGLGGLTSGAVLTAATGGGAAAGTLNSLRAPAAASRLADNVSAQQRVAGAMRGDFGIPGRQNLLDEASARGYDLGAMLRGEQAPLLSKPFATAKKDRSVRKLTPPTPFLERFRGGFGRAKGTSTNVGVDPMKGRFFQYTGHDRSLNPNVHAREVLDRYPEFESIPDGDFDTGGAFGGFDEADFADSGPGNIHNIHDARGNTIGSLTYDRHRDFVDAHEAYIRPEFRKGMEGMKNLKALIKPLVDLGLPINSMVANDKLARLMQAMEARGDIKLTKGTRGSLMHRDPTMRGEPSSGLYPYEVPPSHLPPLIGPMSPNYWPAPIGRFNPFRYGETTGRR